MRGSGSTNRPPTPDRDDEPDRQPSLQDIVNKKFIESGQKETLKHILRVRLVECGWKKELTTICRDYVKEKGRNKVTVDDLISLITPQGRASVPDPIKADMLQRIRSFLSSTTL